MIDFFMKGCGFPCRPWFFFKEKRIAPPYLDFLWTDAGFPALLDFLKDEDFPALLSFWSWIRIEKIRRSQVAPLLLIFKGCGFFCPPWFLKDVDFPALLDFLKHSDFTAFLDFLWKDAYFSALFDFWKKTDCPAIFFVFFCEKMRIILPSFDFLKKGKKNCPAIFLWSVKRMRISLPSLNL